MKIRCVYEHNGDDTILYADNFIGAYARGASLQAAMDKMNREVASYLNWRNAAQYGELPVEIVQEQPAKTQDLLWRCAKNRRGNVCAYKECECLLFR